MYLRHFWRTLKVQICLRKIVIFVGKEYHGREERVGLLGRTVCT